MAESAGLRRFLALTHSAEVLGPLVSDDHSHRCHKQCSGAGVLHLIATEVLDYSVDSKKWILRSVFCNLSTKATPPQL
jgi:hypothetical protein